MARAGLTHAAFLLQGWDPGQTLLIPSLREWSRGNDARRKVTKAEYDSLVQNIPKEWKKVIETAAANKTRNPNASLKDLIQKEAWPEDTWVRLQTGEIGKVRIKKPTVLHMFSGKGGRKDGLAAELKNLNIECEEWDTLIHKEKLDILSDENFNKLRERTRGGQVLITSL